MADLLKSADVARLLRVHPKHVYRLLQKGLPAHRVGGEWRFSREEVLAWSGVGKLSSAEGRPPPLLAANGDLVIELLLGEIAARGMPLVGFVRADRGSALEMLGERVVLLAGFHGDVPPTHLAGVRLARVHLVTREIGLALRTPMKTLRDLRRKRLALRPPSAGVRLHFDHALAEHDLALRELGCAVTLHESHLDCVAAVLRGEADAALTTAAWAERAGLEIFPLATEAYDVLLRASDLGEPACVGACEIAQSRVFRACARKIAGYDPRRAGDIRYEG